MNIRIINRFVKDFISDSEIQKILPQLKLKHKQLVDHTGPGNEFHGWLDLPDKMQKNQSFWDLLEEISNSWKSRGITHIVVVGIGGSYLGSKAVYEALNQPFSHSEYPKLIFAGHHMSATYLEDLSCFLKEVSFGVLVISKSGTTLEPALAFRILRKILTDVYGEKEARSRIISVTDEKKGALRAMTREAGWSSFLIEDSVGGRYSVLSPVGLVPIALAGIDIRNLLIGAAEMQTLCLTEDSFEKNPALQYAAYRYLLLNSGKTVEILASFHPELQYFIEWWKQLFGESDGKNHKGIFPAGVVFSSDLHSLGQYIQEGMRIIFETMIVVTNPAGNILFPESEKNEDGLDYLKGRKVSDINILAAHATMLAHFEGQVPVIGIHVNELNEENIGRLIYFFEFACAIGGYLLGVNPFDQPGVEAYKRNMFALMGKPGMETTTNEIYQKLNPENEQKEN